MIKDLLDKIFGVISISLVLSCSVLGEEDEKNNDFFAEDLAAGRVTLTLENLNDKVLYSSVKRVAMEGSYYHAKRATVLMLDAGDPDIIRRCMKSLKEGSLQEQDNVRIVLMKSSNPKLIPILAEVLVMAGDPYPKSRAGGELIVPSKMVAAATIMGRIVVSSNEFLDLMVSSRTLVPVRPYGPYLKAWRQWWVENKTAIIDEQYKQVKPLRHESKTLTVEEPLGTIRQVNNDTERPLPTSISTP